MCVISEVGIMSTITQKQISNIVKWRGCVSVYHDSSLVDMIHLPKCESLVAVTEPVEPGSRGAFAPPHICISVNPIVLQDYANHITKAVTK